MSIQVNPEEDFHVVVNGNVLALSLDALSAAYEGEVVADDSLIWQPGLGEWMRLDTVLHHLENQEPAAPVAASRPIEDHNDELFFVRIADDEVKQMSIDQLDTAYRADFVDLSTLVWQPGYTEWVPLSVLIGDDSEQDHYSVAPSMPAPVPAPLPPRPASVGPSQSPSAAPRAPSAPPPRVSAAAPFAAPQAAAVPSSAPLPGVGIYPSTRPGPSAYPSAPSAYPSAPTSPPNSLAAVANSYIPHIPAPPAKASPWYARSLVAAAALVALGVAYRQGAGYVIADSLDEGSTQKVWAARVGEPSPNTPYGLERWLGQLDDKYGLDDLSKTESGVEPSLTKLALPETNHEPANAAAAANEPTGGEASAKSAEKPEPSSGATAFGAALSNKPAPAKARPAAPTRTYSKPATKNASSSIPKGGNAYDPMNGAL